MAKKAAKRTPRKQPPKKKEIYSGLFAAGVIFLLFSVLDGGTTFLVLGVVFIVIGLANKNKWDPDACKFDTKTIVKTAVAAFLVAAVMVLFLRYFF